MSDIPMLQGWYDQLAPGLQHIGEGLANLINPNRLAQQQLKAEIARNPETLQQLSDAEALNPGSVTRIFGGAASSILGAPSSKAQSEMDLRGGRSVTDLQNSGTARDQSLFRDVTGTNKNQAILQGNAATLSSAGLSGAVKNAALDEKEADVKLGSFDAKTKLYLSTIQRDQAKTDSDNQILANKIDNFKSLKGQNLSKLAQKAARGQLSPEESQQLLSVQSDETAAKTMDDLIRGYQHADQMSISWAAHKRSIAQDDKLLRRQAFTLARDLEVPGHIDAVMAYLDKPEAATLARDLADGKRKPSTKLEEGLLAVENANRKLISTADTNMELKERARDVQERTERSRVGAKVVSTIEKVRKMSGRSEGDEATQAAVAEINQDLALLTGGQVRYQFNVKNFAKDDDKFVANIGGKETPLSYDQVKGMMFGPSEMQKAREQQQQQTDPLAKWKALSPADREAKLKKLDPAQAAKVRAALGGK
jgi:hypothetical protein